MNSIPEFLSYLRRLDIHLWAEEDRLRYNAPKDALTQELREQLRERKTDILAFLHQATVSTRSSLQPIEQISRDQALSLSFNQQRLWFLNQLEGANPIYNVPMAWRIVGPLNIDVLEQCMTEIVRRHEALRTTFGDNNGTPVQKIAPPWKVYFPVIELDNIPEEHLDAETRKLAFEDIENPFDLTQVPLFRGSVFRLKDNVHVLIIVVHHIIFDVWSIGVLVKELSALYNAFIANQSSPLTELPIQYADFAHWQHTWLSGEVLEQQLLYWKEKLSGILPILELPTDYPRPPVYRFQGAVHSFMIPESIVEATRSLSQKEGVTLFIVLLTVFKILLHRYTNQEDILVGSPIANRTRPEITTLIGFFVNTMVLRTDLSGKPSFLELLKRVKQTAMEAYAHQDVPFQDLVDTLHLERNLSHPPLFQVAFILQNSQQANLELSGFTISQFKGERNTAGVAFDLNLTIEETETGLMGVMEYNQHLFHEATIARMSKHFQNLLQAIVNNPHQPIMELPLLTESERQQLLREWNETKAEYPDEKCIHQLFEEQVAKTPNAPAVMFEGQQLSYHELNQKANQLAHYLRKLGVGPESLVGLCVDRSLEMIIGILGILKAGGAYLPLDPNYPEERLAFMMSDSQIPILLTQDRLRAHLPEFHGYVIALDTDWSLIAQESKNQPQSPVLPENLAYVIYTSGSTGKPKGTLLAHRGLGNLVRAQAQIFNITPQCRVLQFVSLSFDVATSDIFTTLCAGATLCLAPRYSLLPGPGLIQILKNLQISHLALPASILGALPSEELPMLTTIIVGGEACAPEIVERWARGRQFFNAYGPTEATICTTTAEYTLDHSKLPIGRPLSHITLYILDVSLQPVPVGVPGELYIGGIGLARGYQSRADLTAEKFIPNPFSKQAGSRMYKTGDLVRYWPDGNIEFLGRIDHQVKIRGFRIELGEIEAALASYPIVQNAVVLVREDQSGQKRLVAYLVPEKSDTLSISELRQFLKDKLPDYMVPSAYVILDALPLTPNGKIDRRALPVPETISDNAEKTYVAPRTPAEEELAQIWKEVLKLEKIGIYDDFFESGGHSLLAAQLMSRIQQQFNQNIPISLLFRSPTIAQLAEIISQAVSSEVFSPLIPLQTQGATQPFFAIHPGNGQVFCYTELIHQLGNRQRFYGLQAFGVEPATTLLLSVPEMASQYIQAIRAVQPQGPYLLGGFCIGGTIAYEMAQQLEQQGEQIDKLVLLDTLAPHLYERMQETAIDDEVQHFMVFSHEVGVFFGKDLIPIYAKIRDLDLEHNGIEVIRRDLVSLSPQQRLEILFSCTQQAGIPLPEEGIEYLKRLIRIHRINAQAIFEYTPRPYNASPVILLSARDNQMNKKFDAALGWHKYVSEELLRVEEVPGDHFSMLRTPHVTELATTLSQILAMAT